MSRSTRVSLHRAELELGPGVDPAAPGAAITVALCGDWDHDGPCRWPHHTEIDTSMTPARLRTAFVSPEADRAEVRRRIGLSLEGDHGWTVVSSGPSEPDAAAERLGFSLLSESER